MKSSYTAEEAKALNLFGKRKPGGKKELPPIKVKEAPKVKPAMESQLDISDIEKALDRLQFRVANGAYIEHHPTHKIIKIDEFEFILKPLKP